MKRLFVFLAIVLISASAFAQLGTTMYTGTTGTGKQTAAGTVFVNFTLIGFTGSISNASFSNASVSIPVWSAYQGGAGQRLNPIIYTVTSGTLIITEVK